MIVIWLFRVKHKRYLYHLLFFLGFKLFNLSKDVVKWTKVGFRVSSVWRVWGGRIKVWNRWELCAFEMLCVWCYLKVYISLYFFISLFFPLFFSVCSFVAHLTQFFTFSTGEQQHKPIYRPIAFPVSGGMLRAFGFPKKNWNLKVNLLLNRSLVNHFLLDFHLFIITSIDLFGICSLMWHTSASTLKIHLLSNKFDMASLF